MKIDSFHAAAFDYFSGDLKNDEDYYETVEQIRKVKDLLAELEEPVHYESEIMYY